MLTALLRLTEDDATNSYTAGSCQTPKAILYHIAIAYHSASHLRTSERIVFHGMAWHGMAWHGMPWHAMASHPTCSQTGVGY